MYLAYVDESGNSGKVAAGGTRTFTLGCVLIEHGRWPDVFDDLINFRRFLKSRFAIPVRAEIKANYLLHNRGPHFNFHPLGERARFAVYRGFMRLLPKLELKAFAIVVRKELIKCATIDARETAREYLFQRLERLTTKGNTHAILLHDEGEGALVRRLGRKARRAGTAGSAFGTGMLKRPARLVIDDPIGRQSSESYLIQCADLVAYAGFRKVFAPPALPAGRVHVVPQTMWDV